MSIVQKRRSISVSADTYARLSAYCERPGQEQPRSHFVESVVIAALDAAAAEAAEAMRRANAFVSDEQLAFDMIPDIARGGWKRRPL